MNDILCGVTGLYKPAGFTSFDAVAKLRGIFGIKRIGHGGTLDPMAEGVLPVFFGRATLACDMLPDSDKIYRAGFKLGITTDTQDITGTVTDKKDFSDISREKLCSVTEKFRGEIMQTPPMYSAVSVNGKRLYELARQNITVEREPRRITVYSLEPEDFDSEKGEGTLTISCSKGTYIRTLINDMGDTLGTGAVMTSLLRTRACGIALEDCVTFEELEKGGDLTRFITPVESVFSYLPAVYLTPDEERLYRNGIQLKTERTGCDISDGRVRVYGEDFIGIAQIKDGLIISEKTFVLSDNFNYKGGYAAALGIFDGVHAGHRKVISEAKKTAEELKLKTAVFTFKTESMAGSGKELSASCVMTEEEKEKRLRSLGVDKIFSPPFSQFKDMSADDFVKKVLKDRMKAEAVICGEDFRCGKGAVCDTAELERLCGKYGLTFRSVPLVPDKNGGKISSGRIRELISQGNMTEAAELTGGYYTFNAKVTGGKKLGRTLGFPTINQKIPECMVLPRYGVYAAEVTISGKTYRGLANVGVKPTVADSGEVLCETYIFDFEGDIYGYTVETSLLKFIRGEKKFSSKEELKKQVLLDIELMRN